MPETSTDEEDVIRQKETKISKLQAELDALASNNNTATTTITTQPPAGTSLVEENAIGNTGESADNAIIIPTTPQTKEDNDLNALYETSGKLKYTTSIFENLSIEYHPDLINLILYTMEKYEYFKSKKESITNLQTDGFIPKRIQVVNKIHLEHHDDTTSDGLTCANLKKWDDRRKQYQDEMK